MQLTAIAKMRRRPKLRSRFLRWCVAAACVTSVIAAAFPGNAGALSPALGRWSGGGSAGRIQFAVSRVSRTLVLSDVVVSCRTAEGVDGDDLGPLENFSPENVNRDEMPIGRNGRIEFGRAPAGRSPDLPISGRLNGRSGRVTADGAIADLGAAGGCPAASLRDVRVAPTGARVLRDGVYLLGGPAGTRGTFWVYGEGALIEWEGSFGTPLGGLEEDPTLCESSVASASFPGDGFNLGLPDSGSPILPGSDGSFSLHTVEDNIGLLDEVSLSGRFTSASSAVGTYSATWADGVAITCAGDGPFALALVHAAPALEPAAAPEPLHKRGKPGKKKHPPTPPAPNADRCAMRFQIQQGKKTPHSWPVHAARPITVKEALAGLDVLRSQVTGGLRKASARAFTDTRNWVIARPQHGGVSATGNVKRVFFHHEKKNWRLDTENLRCRNLTS